MSPFARTSNPASSARGRKAALETVRRGLARAAVRGRARRRLGHACAARIDASTRPASPRGRGGFAAIAASLVLLGLLAGLLLRADGPVTAPAAGRSGGGPRTEHPAAIEQLRDRSRALEEVLAALPARPAVERAGTAVPIETLQAQVQWVDHQLTCQALRMRRRTSLSGCGANEWRS